MFDSDRYKGRIGLLSESGDLCRLVLKYLGIPMETQDPAAFAQSAADADPAEAQCIAVFHEDNGQDLLLAGDIDIVVEYNGDIAQVMREDKDLDFVVPKEGSQISSDCLGIPKGAPNPELATEFINYLLDARAGAEISKTIRYPTPNARAKALMDAEYRDNPVIFPPQAILYRKCEYATHTERPPRGFTRRSTRACALPRGGARAACPRQTSDQAPKPPSMVCNAPVIIAPWGAGKEGRIFRDLAGMGGRLIAMKPCMVAAIGPSAGVHVAVCRSRLDGVHGDAALAEVARQAAHHALNRRLGERIGRTARKRHAIAVHRADDDDAAIRVHPPRRLHRRMIRRAHSRRSCGPPHRDRGSGIAEHQHPGIDDDHIQRAASRDRLLRTRHDRALSAALLAPVSAESAFAASTEPA